MRRPLITKWYINTLIYTHGYDGSTLSRLQCRAAFAKSFHGTIDWGRVESNHRARNKKRDGHDKLPGRPAHPRSYKGVLPVVPTVFDGEGRLDLDGQKCAVDCMIDAGSQGLSLVLRWGK
jgi:hypothetical protein